MEDLSGLYLLAEVCDQEQNALPSSFVPVKFPKKRRSSLLLIKNETETTTDHGLKLKAFPTLVGKGCYFKLDNGHAGDKIGDDAMATGFVGFITMGTRSRESPPLLLQVVVVVMWTAMGMGFVGLITKRRRSREFLLLLVVLVMLMGMITWRIRSR